VGCGSCCEPLWATVREGALFVPVSQAHAALACSSSPHRPLALTLPLALPRFPGLPACRRMTCHSASRLRRVQLHNDQARHYVHGLYALAYRDLAFTYCTFAYILLDFFTTSLWLHIPPSASPFLPPRPICVSAGFSDTHQCPTEALAPQY